MCGLSTVVTPAGASLTMYREIRSYANSIWDDNNNNNNKIVFLLGYRRSFEIRPISDFPILGVQLRKSWIPTECFDNFPP